MRYLSIIIFIFCGCLFSTSSSFAQTSEQQIEAQEQALRQINEVETQRLESEGADRYRGIEGGPVTLAQVMKNPDDINLNYRYAQTQVADGNLRGASATLERILLINPNLAKIRLFYAYVLYRLDNNKELQEQLKMLEGMHLSAANQEEVVNLRKRAARRLKTTTFTAMLAAGFAYQTNANFSPDSGFNDVIVPTPLGTFTGQVPVASPKEDDVSWIGSASIGFHHDLGRQEGHYLFGSASTYWNEQVNVDSTDYNTFAGNIGIKYFAPWADITGQFLAGHFRLDDHSFLNYYAFDINFQKEFLKGALRTNFRHRTTYEDYDVGNTLSQERTGPRYEFAGGADYQLTYNQAIGGVLTYTNKKADAAWREFDGLDINIHHTWIVSRGIYIRNQLDYGYEDYNAANPRVSVLKRSDDIFRYQATFSTPLGRLFKNMHLPRAIADVRANASLRYSSTNSNIQNYEYDNFRFELIFSKSFDL